MKYKPSDDIPKACYLCGEYFKIGEEIKKTPIPRVTEMNQPIWVHCECYKVYIEAESMSIEELIDALNENVRLRNK